MSERMEITPEQDAVLDCANGVRAAVTTSVVLLTPGYGCRYVAFWSDAACYLNTAGAAAVVPTGATCTAYPITANADPVTLPVTPGVAIYAISVSGTANINAIPYKSRI